MTVLDEGQPAVAESLPDETSPSAGYVYAIGRIEPRLPSLGIEKELAQATGRAETQGLTDRQATHAVLSEPANRYLARKLCWVLTIEGIDTYILVPRDTGDVEMLIDAVRPETGEGDVDVVIGLLGPIAPASACNGLAAPTVFFDQIYSFDTYTLVEALPVPESFADDDFRAAAREVFGRMQQVADNAGATAEHRAVNYLSVRYPAIYEVATEQFGMGASLTSVDVVPSALSGVREIVEVVFTYTDRRTGVHDKRSVRVDTTEEFPFLVDSLSPYFER